MSSKMFKIEFAENPENRCPVVLVLDTSGSMNGEPIEELNRGLLKFKEEIMSDNQASLSVEIAVITFGDEVRLVQDFVTVDNFHPEPLYASGTTPMGGAVEEALYLLTRRKRQYQDNQIGYYRPWLLLMTDGQPTDSWYKAAESLKEQEQEGKVSPYAIAVGNEVNVETLRKFTNSGTVLQLNGLDFSKLFKWLSASMMRVSVSSIGSVVALPPVDWGNKM